MKDQIKKNWLNYTGGLLALILVIVEARSLGDFNLFLSASRDLVNQGNIYQIRYNQWYHYYYDIIFALFLVPFTWLPYSIANALWLILNVFFIYRLWRIISGWIPIDNLSKRMQTAFIILSFVFIFRFIRDNFHLGQVTIFILYLSIEGIYLIRNNKRIAGSLLIAIGINIKIFPLALIPYLIYRKEWRSALIIILFIGLLIFLPAFVIGYDYNAFLLTERWKLLNPMNKEHILDTSERSFHSLTTLLATLLVEHCDDTHILKIRRNIADITLDNLKIVILIIRSVFILFTLYFLRTLPFRKTTSNIWLLYELSYICIAIPLIFPHQQYYAFFFIFPASTYILYFFFARYLNQESAQRIKNYKRKRNGFITLLLIIFFLTSSHFVLGHFTEYYDHFKTLTYGVIMLVILLAFCDPKKLDPAGENN